MRIYKTKDYNEMSRKAANIISAQVIMKPDAVLGLATGSTPLGAYRQLIDWYKKGDLDFSETRSVNLDEYKGLAPSDPQSYAYFMQENFFRHINIKPENTNIPNGLETDENLECRRYNSVIKQLGGIDIQLLGIGNNAHIGFNEPGEAFEKETHCVRLGSQVRLFHRNQKYHASQKHPFDCIRHRKGPGAISLFVRPYYASGSRFHSAASQQCIDCGG